MIAGRKCAKVEMSTVAALRFSSFAQDNAGCAKAINFSAEPLPVLLLDEFAGDQNNVLVSRGVYKEQTVCIKV